MKLLYGLNDMALLQRGSNDRCFCTFGAQAEGELKTSLGRLTKTDAETYILTDIPSGGPYSVTISDSVDSSELTLWVGDIWLLGGQSNMEGAGRFGDEEYQDEAHPDPDIRAYYEDNRWDAALPMLHEPWISVDACQREVWTQNQLASRWHCDKPGFIAYGLPKRGIGPGVYFARELKRITIGIPQALIPCALGGSAMTQWDPDSKTDNLYHAMIRRVKRVGGKVRGLFWYQGCSECSVDRTAEFNDRMIRMVESVRRDCKDDRLPFVQVQIAKNNLHTSSYESGMDWERLREKQRTLHELIPNMDTVAAIDSSYDDLIHLSTESQKLVGLRGANSMAYLCGFGGASAPKLDSVELRDDESRPFFAVLAIKYKYAEKLGSIGAPLGFSITETPDERLCTPTLRIARIAFEGDTVLIFTEMTRDELAECYLHYGYLNMAHCTIRDQNGHSIPAMGPLKIAELLS